MSYKPTVVQTVVKPDQKARLDQMARSKGVTTSTLSRLYITKGMAEDAPPPKAQELVDGGMCPDLAAAEKLLKFMKPRGAL